MLGDITHETRAILESMSGGLCTLTADAMCNCFQCLVWHQWQSEDASMSFMCLFLNPYDLHVQSPCVYQSSGSYHHHHLYYAHVVRFNCESYDHDVNSCPYHVICYEGFVRLNGMIKIVNEQNAKFEIIYRRITYHMTPTLAYLLLDLRLACVMLASLHFP